MLYDRQCQSCGHVEETAEKMNDTAPTACPKCDKKEFIRIVLSAPQVLFKGSWPGKDIAIERKHGFKRNPRNPDA